MVCCTAVGAGRRIGGLREIQRDGYPSVETAGAMEEVGIEEGDGENDQAEEARLDVTGRASVDSMRAF